MKTPGFVRKIIRTPSRLAQAVIIVYQKTLSLDHGPLARVYKRRVCRFWPTCSEYGYEAIGRFGLWRGSWMTVKRLLRCHPWQIGGVDPVPESATEPENVSPALSVIPVSTGIWHPDPRVHEDDNG